MNRAPLGYLNCPYGFATALQGEVEWWLCVPKWATPYEVESPAITTSSDICVHTGARIVSRVAKAGPSGGACVNWLFPEIDSTGRFEEANPDFHPFSGDRLFRASHRFEKFGEHATKATFEAYLPGEETNTTTTTTDTGVTIHHLLSHSTSILPSLRAVIPPNSDGGTSAAPTPNTGGGNNNNEPAVISAALGSFFYPGVRLHYAYERRPRSTDPLSLEPIQEACQYFYLKKADVDAINARYAASYADVVVTKTMEGDVVILDALEVAARKRAKDLEEEAKRKLAAKTEELKIAAKVAAAESKKKKKMPVPPVVALGVKRMRTRRSGAVVFDDHDDDGGSSPLFADSNSSSMDYNDDGDDSSDNLLDVGRRRRTSKKNAASLSQSYTNKRDVPPKVGGVKTTRSKRKVEEVPATKDEEENLPEDENTSPKIHPPPSMSEDAAASKRQPPQQQPHGGKGIREYITSRVAAPLHDCCLVMSSPPPPPITSPTASYSSTPPPLMLCLYIPPWLIGGVLQCVLGDKSMKHSVGATSATSAMAIAKFLDIGEREGKKEREAAAGRSSANISAALKAHSSSSASKGLPFLVPLELRALVGGKTKLSDGRFVGLGVDVTAFNTMYQHNNSKIDTTNKGRGRTATMSPSSSSSSSSSAPLTQYTEWARKHGIVSSHVTYSGTTILEVTSANLSVGKGLNVTPVGNILGNTATTSVKEEMDREGAEIGGLSTSSTTCATHVRAQRDVLSRIRGCIDDYTGKGVTSRRGRTTTAVSGDAEEKYDNEDPADKTTTIRRRQVRLKQEEGEGECGVMNTKGQPRIKHGTDDDDGGEASSSCSSISIASSGITRAYRDLLAGCQYAKDVMKYFPVTPRASACKDDVYEQQEDEE